jgi:uncharacterized membrane protein
MLDLYNNKYNRQTLKNNIYAVNLIDILKTQHLDITFVVRYILNNKYQLTKEEEEITVDTVLKYQKHLSLQKLIVEINKYDKDDDSIDDFQTVARKDDKFI